MPDRPVRVDPFRLTVPAAHLLGLRRYRLYATTGTVRRRAGGGV
jgi:hypothetical protein